MSSNTKIYMYRDVELADGSFDLITFDMTLAAFCEEFMASGVDGLLESACLFTTEKERNEDLRAYLEVIDESRGV